MTGRSPVHVDGVPRLVLRTEGAVVLAGALLVWHRSGHDWGTFALYFLVPDISFVGYLAGARTGAVMYNVAHSYVGALASVALGHAYGLPWAIMAGLIWTAHIGFDRMLGYGLKYETGFRHTHLGIIGPKSAD